MLREWKMMRVERCKSAFATVDNWYYFPNGIHLRLATIRVDMEKANAVVAQLADWKPTKKMKKGEAVIKLDFDRYKTLTIGELEDFKWRIYSLDV